jgi:hypothetical protein
MHVISAIDLAGLIYVGIGSKSFFDEATHLFFVVGVPFNGIHDKAMS